MIHFLATPDGLDTMYMYFASWGRRFIWDIRPVTYAEVLDQPQHPPGAYIFGDLDRLEGPMRQRTAELWQRLNDRGDDYRLLNHPTRTLRRFDLLQRLAAEGINRHRAFHITDSAQAMRFPVFLRRENDHDGTQSPPLPDQAALDRAIEALRARNVDLTHWIIVEFCDTSDDEDIYRSYSSYIVDGHIIPHHLMFSKHWVIKGPKSYRPDHLAEEMDHMNRTPHDAEVRRVFELAHVDYGRIDYAFFDGSIEVWEINTNPVVTTPSYTHDIKRHPVHDRFNDGFSAVVEQLLQVGQSNGRSAPSPLRRLKTYGIIGYEKFRETGLGKAARRIRRRLRGESG